MSDIDLTWLDWMEPEPPRPRREECSCDCSKTDDLGRPLIIGWCGPDCERRP